LHHSNKIVYGTHYALNWAELFPMGEFKLAHGGLIFALGEIW